jgi:hypothetical protein
MNKREGSLEITPQIGLGPILFGMSVSDVERVQGRANGASVFDGGDEWTLSLHYPGVDLFFDQSEDFRLTVIEVNQEIQCRLFGEPLFPMTRQELFEFLGRNLSETALSEIEERRAEDLEEVAVNLPSILMTFYFSLEDELQVVNWAVLVGPDDETVWPD